MNSRKYIVTIIALIFISTTFIYKKFFGKPYFVATPKMITIDLDAKPEERWLPLINNMSKDNILTFAKKTHEIIQNKIPAEVREKFSDLVNTNLIPEEYKQELRGIEAGLKEKLGSLPDSLTYENLVTFNLAYMLFVSCTSCIITDHEDMPYLFRNLDWPMSFLRAATINITWLKNGKKLFKSTGWPFFVGVLTGQRSNNPSLNNFALAINARHNKKDLAIDNINYALKEKDVWSSPSLLRHTLQYAKDYREAYAIFKNVKLCAPVYIALAGTKKNEGAILNLDRDGTRITDKLKKWSRYYPEQPAHTNPENSRSPWILAPQHAQNHYIAVTNIDSDYPSFQDFNWACKTGICKPSLTSKKINSVGPKYRRNSVLNSCCMLQKTFTIDDLFNTLWIKPVLNYQTIYSSVMCPAKNIYRSYIIYPKK